MYRRFINTESHTAYTHRETTYIHGLPKIVASFEIIIAVTVLLWGAECRLISIPVALVP